MKSFVSTLVSEFFARGLVWLRVLLLAGLMPVDQYGLLLVYLSVEGLIGGVASYPFIKDAMVRQDLSSKLYWGYIFVFGVVAFLATAGAFALTTFEWSVGLGLFFASFFNGLTQVALYSIRVAHVESFNRIKLVWSIVTTTLFLWLLPINWLWLPVVYFFGFVVVWTGSFNKAIRTNRPKAAYEAGLSYHMNGWLIFGIQALMLNLPQHGIRIIIGAFMTVEAVAEFTIAYMQSTVVFFIYSALMITCEAELSRAASTAELRSRILKATRYAIGFVLIAILHFLAVMLLSSSGLVSFLFDAQPDSGLTLTLILVIFVALNGVQTVLNSVVLAASGRHVTLLATGLGALLLLALTIFLIPFQGLIGVALAMAIGQLVTVGILVSFLIFRLAKARV